MALLTSNGKGKCTNNSIHNSRHRNTCQWALTPNSINVWCWKHFVRHMCRIFESLLFWHFGWAKSFTTKMLSSAAALTKRLHSVLHIANSGRPFSIPPRPATTIGCVNSKMCGTIVPASIRYVTCPPRRCSRRKAHRLLTLSNYIEITNYLAGGNAQGLT